MLTEAEAGVAMSHCNPLKAGAGDWFGENKVGGGQAQSSLHRTKFDLLLIGASFCPPVQTEDGVCWSVSMLLVCEYFNSCWCDPTTRTQILALHLKELQIWHMLGRGECRRREYCSAATGPLKYFLSGKGVVILLPTLFCQK